MIRCRAAVANGVGEFQIDDIVVGPPQAGEVLVEMRAAGICHTDHASLRWNRPLVMGHEGAGIVRALGAGVDGLAVGDPVLLNWAIPCGTCRACSSGDMVLCETSRPAHVLERSAGHAHPEGTLWRDQPIDRSFNIGTLSEWTLVRAPAVTRIPSSVPFASACIVGCGVMTGFGSVVNVARPEPGDTVAVIGCGGVGLNILQAARLVGAGKIIALDPRETSLASARRYGATDTLLAAPDDPHLEMAARQVRELTQGRGADYAFEATSVPRLAFAPLRMIRDGGMALQVSGINDPVTVDMRDFMWNKRYVTPLYGGCVPSRDFSRIFDHYLRGEIRLDELVTRTYRLEDLALALEDMMLGRNAKGVILFS